MLNLEKIRTKYLFKEIENKLCMDKKNLEKNIIKYNLLKIFTKRVYLPLIAIYLLDVGHVSLAQLGIMGSANAIINLCWKCRLDIMLIAGDIRSRLSSGRQLWLCQSYLIYFILVSLVA